MVWWRAVCVNCASTVLWGARGHEPSAYSTAFCFTNVALLRQTVLKHGSPSLAESRRRQKPCRDVRFARPRTCHRHVPTPEEGFSHLSSPYATATPCPPPSTKHGGSKRDGSDRARSHYIAGANPAGKGIANHP